MACHVQILDEYFHKQFEGSRTGQHLCLNNDPFAIIALGGYGRGEQCIHSDIDLLFLFGKRIPGAAEKLIQSFVYPLWDIGLEVSPATRSLKECISLASKDCEILIPVLDARFICGASSLYLTLKEQLHKKIVVNQSAYIIEWLVERNRQRHRHFGDSSYLLEPNLKEGQGGLRDYHTLLWIARIRSNLQQRRDLEYFGYLSHNEFAEFDRALDYIWTVRNRLHHLTGRKCDQMYKEFQPRLAEDLEYKKRNDQEPVERFLGDLHGHMTILKQLHLMLLYEMGYNEKVQSRQKSTRRLADTGLEIKKGMIHFSSSEQILKHPDILFHIFRESARLNIPLSAESKRLVKEFKHLLNDACLSSPRLVQLFEKTLVDLDPESDVLDNMLNTGLLVRFIPELKGVVNRIQYNEYHMYPVDRHLLQTVQTLKRFGVSESQPAVLNPLCRDLYLGVKRPGLLLWAALLHDIGKAEPGGGHSEKGARIVRGLLDGKGFKKKNAELISFLVQEHLFLIKTATRRDITDEETAVACARKIGNVERLHMLYLLTVADSISTGPKAWNEWTSTLLRDLFFKVLGVLEKGELASREAVKSVEKKKEQILSSISSPKDRSMTAAVIHTMSPRYLLYTPSADISAHVALWTRLGSRDFILDVTRTPEADMRQVTVCARDRPGLFSKIAGVFTLNGIDILEAQIYTWRNNIALDIFKVKPPPDRLFEHERWSKVQKDLDLALAEKLVLAKAIAEKIPQKEHIRPRTAGKPARVVVDNKSSSFFNIIEVFTYDFPGLLFKITDAIYRCRLDIRVAKIATNVDQVVDVFYVRDFEAQKMDLPDQVEAVKTAIMSVLPVC